MSWFIFIKFDDKIYVFIMSWFIFIKIDIHIYIYIYVWKLIQTVLELDFRAVKFLFFPRRDLNPHHWNTAAPFASRPHPLPIYIYADILIYFVISKKYAFKIFTTNLVYSLNTHAKTRQLLHLIKVNCGLGVHWYLPQFYTN